MKTSSNIFTLSGLLTKKFINLIKHADAGVLDLNKAADTLEVIVLVSNPLLLTMSSC